MASTQDAERSNFLPPLDSCLNGNARLISWKQAFKSLQLANHSKPNTALQTFVKDKLSIQQLCRTLQPFAQPTAQTKQEYETRTAAISITASQTGHYSIDQIKEDTLWLSEQFRIDEVTALRIVTLEWQCRAEYQVLRGYSEGELISVQQAVGNPGLDTGTFARRHDLLQRGDAADFSPAVDRRIRLLHLFVQERQYVLATQLFLIQKYSLGETVMTASVLGHSEANLLESSESWLGVIWKLLQDAQSKLGKQLSGNSKDGIIPDCVRATQQRLESLQSGHQWKIAGDDPLPELEVLHADSQLLEVLLIFQICFATLAAEPGKPMSPTAAKQWFSFMDTYHFFEKLQPPFPQQSPLISPIQILTSLISLRVLNLPLALDQICSATADQGLPMFLLDQDCFNTINELMFNAAEHSPVVASPTIFAWSVILRDVRIRQQSLIDQFTLGAPGDGDSSPSLVRQLTSQQEKALQQMTAIVADLTSRGYDQQDAVYVLARKTLDESQLLSVLAEMCNTFKLFLGIAGDRLEYFARLIILEILRHGLHVTSYIPEIVDVCISLLDVVDITESNQLTRKQILKGICQAILDDDEVLVPGLIEQALARYPLEMSPFLALARRLTSFSIDGTPFLALLAKASRFTERLPRDFVEYESVREDENANLVQLVADLQIFGPSYNQDHNQKVSAGNARTALVRTKTHEEDAEWTIPRGTDGSVLSESKPFVVMWDHQHSSIRYLARVLAFTVSAREQYRPVEGDIADLDTQAGIVALFASQLCVLVGPAGSTMNSEPNLVMALEIMQEASDALGRTEDLITTVTRIFEGELSRAVQDITGSVTLLASCVQFFQATAHCVPSRIWSILARSELLEIDGIGGRINSIISSTELVAGRYEFVMRSLDLYSSLIADIIHHCVQREAPTTTASKRFVTSNSIDFQGLPRKVVNKVMLALTKVFIDILQNSRSWHFSSEVQRMALTTQILDVFTTLMHSVFAFDDSRPITTKICGDLASSAQYLLDAVLSTSGFGSIQHYILSMCLSASQSARRMSLELSLNYIALQANASIRFMTLALRIGEILDTPISYLEKQIVHAMPFFVRLYASSISHRSHIIQLISVLARRLTTTEKEPPSLLGDLAPETAEALSVMLMTGCQNAMDERVVVLLWELATNIISSRQPWFTTLLLTGSSPKHSVNDKANANGGTKHQSRTMLQLALNGLDKNTSMSSPESIAKLAFINTAQAHWPWVTRRLRDQSSVIDYMLHYIGSLEREQKSKELDRAKEIHAAAIIAEIVALYLHNSRQLGDVSMHKNLAGRLTYYERCAMLVPQYNSSLQSNLEKNLASRFPGLKLSSFKKLLATSHCDDQCYYDIMYAESCLKATQAWNNGKGRGFADEFTRANNNLSLVQSQILLTTSFKILALELSQTVNQSQELERLMAKVVQNALVANTDSRLPENIFEHLIGVRTDLAFVVLQRLVGMQSKDETITNLLNICWDVIRGCEQDFEVPFTGSNAAYYRSLLQILFLTLQAQIYLSRDTTTTRVDERRAIATLLEISTQVIAKGFRGLASQLHEDRSLIKLSDFSLITSLFRTILRIPEMELAQSPLAAIFADMHVARYAVALFSWSASLSSASKSNENNDSGNILAELSLGVLREMSTLPLLAEHLASESVLAQLSTTHILSLLRDGPATYLSNMPRLGAIWLRGILPLVLNLLVAVGEFYVAEATAFLNSFKAQLDRTTLAPPTGGAKLTNGQRSGATQVQQGITLDLAAGLHTLALIHLALERYRSSPSAAQGAGEMVEALRWDTGTVKDDVDTLLQGRRVTLRARIAPSSERELAMMRMESKDKKGKTIGHGGEAYENRLEELIVKELVGVQKCLGGN